MREALRLTIDTSVFISRLPEDDPSHSDSRAFLDALPGKAVIIVLPTLVGLEMAGATRRFTGQPLLAREALELLDALPNLNLVPVDQQLAAGAANLAAEAGMRLQLIPYDRQNGSVRSPDVAGRDPTLRDVPLRLSRVATG
jgi:predicted nucleic acid-binding protein